MPLHTVNRRQPSDRLAAFSFYRQIPLPDGIDTEQAQASYKNGVLTLRFAKTRPQSSARRIPITTEQQSQQRAA